MPSRELIDLFLRIKREVEESDGSWPGSDVVDVLTGTFTAAGIDVEQGAEQFADQVAELVRVIKTEIEAADWSDGAEPVAVVFRSTEWDNGFFLDEASATVHLANGSREPFEFGEIVREHLTEQHGTVGRSAALGVNLRTGAVEFAEADLDDTVLALLNG